MIKGDCCHRYMDCSNARECVHPEKENVECAYGKHLEAGRIFYGRNKNYPQSKKPYENKGIYLELSGRQFGIFIRSRFYSRYLGKEQIDTVINELDRLDVCYSVGKVDSKCWIDTPTTEKPEYANSRIYAKIAGLDINISNHNSWLLQRETCQYIKDYLNSKGIWASTENVGPNRVVNFDSVEKKQYVKPEPIDVLPEREEPKQEVKPKKLYVNKLLKDKKNKKLVPEQMSLFDQVG